MDNQRLTVNSLINASGGDSNQDITLDEMFGWYLNITFAVLFVFMIASFLFRTELKEEAQKAIDERDYVKSQWEVVKSSEEGQQYQKREEALINFQKQELLNAIDAVEAEDRKTFGLSIFSTVKENGKIDFNVEEIISGDKVFKNPHILKYFVGGSVLAKEKLPYATELQKDWIRRVLEKSKKRMLKKNEKPMPIVDDTEVLEASNQAWLVEEVGKRTGTLYTEYCEFQAAVLTHLYRFYFQNPKSLDGTEVAGLLNRYFKASPEIKSSLLKEIDAKLYNQAKKTLENQGVMILSGASE